MESHNGINPTILTLNKKAKSWNVWSIGLIAVAGYKNTGPYTQISRDKAKCVTSLLSVVYLFYTIRSLLGHRLCPGRTTRRTH